MRRLLLALDTSTEVTTVGLAWLGDERVEMFAGAVVEAPRAAMSQVLPAARSLLSDNRLGVSEISEVIVGLGPGSFTGVRIGVSTAKGLAHGLGVPLRGVGTLDAIAWGCAEDEGLLGVVGDAMRGEVYPALFSIGGGLAERLTPDRVASPDDAAGAWAELGRPIRLAGNGLRKYEGVFLEALGENGSVAEPKCWAPYARGLFAAYAAASALDELGTGDPAFVLPIYTRLSDAEEAEVRRDGQDPRPTPASGVAGGGETR